MRKFISILIILVLAFGSATAVVNLCRISHDACEKPLVLECHFKSFSVAENTKISEFYPSPSVAIKTVKEIKIENDDDYLARATFNFEQPPPADSTLVKLVHPANAPPLS